MSTTVERLTNALIDRYTIEREVGRGGMATVFLAHDVRHDRRVAVKVLDPELAAVLGADRFLSEIKVTANLQHPNILPLFDSGVADGLLYYVMPFVEGESLRTRLERERQLPVDDALRITSAVANALDYAHQHGVIHRDLKPENILLQHGQPVVADFGIALAVSNAGGTRITQTGLSLGTPHYMSPEQATGDKVIDARTDVYSLACMAYEMLVGEPPYSGPSSQAIIARLLTETPRRVRSLRGTVPEPADAAIARALEKLPADRFATAGEFARALQGSGATEYSMRSTPTRTARTSWPARSVRAAPWIAVAATLGVLAWREQSRSTTEPASPVRFVLETPGGLPLLNPHNIAISDDGGSIAYVTGEPLSSRVALRRLGQMNVVIVPGTEGALAVNFLSGDRHLMVRFPTRIDRIPIDGGAATTIASVISPAGFSSGSGQVVIGLDSVRGLSTVSGAGGPLRPLSRPDTMAGETGQRSPVVLADGTILYISFVTANTSRIGVADLAGKPNAILPLSGVSCVVGYIEGHVIYVTIDGTLMAVPVDLKRRSIVGDPLELDRQVAINYGGTGCNVMLASNGTLAYATRSEAVTPVLVSPNGSVRTIDSIPRTYRTPRFSPDGRRLAFTVTDRSSTDIYVYELSTGTSTRLPNDGHSDRPEWSLDGRHLMYRALRDPAAPLWQRSVDGSSQPEPVKGAPPRSHHGVIMPDGRVIARTWSLSGKTEIYIASATGEAPPRRLVAPTKGFAMAPAVSPDGKWLAYNADETGQFEIYVMRIDGRGARYKVSDVSGIEPIWSRDGRRLFYRAGNRLFAATLALRGSEGGQSTPEVTVVRRDLILAPAFRWQDDAVQRSYDLSPDGREFLLLRESDEPARLIVALNWTTEFRERLAAVRAQSAKGR